MSAGFAVYRDGRCVREDGDVEALTTVASCTKGVVAICVLMLAERGALPVDAPVSDYWPEFGKPAMTVRHVLSHRAGLPYLDPDPGLTGLDRMTGPGLLRALEQAEPWWEPGTAYAYHPVTYGTILAEVVRRVTGMTLGAWFAAHVAGPLGLEYWIGLPAELDDRVVPGVWESGRDPWQESAAAPAEGDFARRRRAANAAQPPMEPAPADRRAYYGAEVPASLGITNARSLARLYAAVIGEVDGIRLLAPETVAAACVPQTDGVPAMQEDDDARFGLGFQLPSPGMPSISPSTFGHSGAGGRVGLADPSHGIAAAFVCTDLREDDERAARLVASLSA